MAEQLRKDLFRIKVPLPNTPLKYLNAYVVRAPNKSLLIDTGLNHETCFAAIEDGLRQIGVNLTQMDIFITHLHADHFSLVSALANETTQVFFNRPDADIVESWEGFDFMIAHASKNGFPTDFIEEMLVSHPANKFGSEWFPELKILEDGQEISYGDYTFICIETPGHTFGHMCLYETNKKILVSGDHILIDITPNIQCWSDQDNPLKQYLESLKKIYSLDVDLVLPGHRSLFKDHRVRIDELLAHHEARLTEVLDILAQGPMTAFETASKMTWDIKADSWDAFPIAQQWFATSEAMSHLRYLEVTGKIKKIANEKLNKYSIL